MSWSWSPKHPLRSNRRAASHRWTNSEPSHARLLMRHRESGATPDVLREIEDFLGRGAATGAVLDDDEGRWAGQGMLDYWATVLYRADSRRSPLAQLADLDEVLLPRIPNEPCPYRGLERLQGGRSGVLLRTKAAA